MKKCIVLLCTLLLFVPALTGCAEQKGKNSVAGKIYTYSGKPFSELESDEAFTITINDDGTYSYYESLLSSYIGNGKWSVADGVLTLSDDSRPEIVNYFKIDGEDLVFLEEGSTNFLYVKVKDGERFHGAMMSKDE